MIEIIAAGVTALEGAVGIVKHLGSVGKTFTEAEHKVQMAELLFGLASVQTSIAEANTELLKKDEEIRNLKAKLEVVDSLVFKQPFYYRINTAGGEEGPFCSRCYDVGHNLVRLYIEAGNAEFARCPECKFIYQR